jgi:ribulose-5-phosphate 4-epimerase/fuculose-1-phosphate aldolase
MWQESERRRRPEPALASTFTSAPPGSSIRHRFRPDPLKVATQPRPRVAEPVDVEAARTHRLQRLAAAFRLFARYGYDHGVAGHITARDPELIDHFWVNPLAVPFGRIRVSDLQLVSHDGTIVIGDRPINTAAFAIHSQVHAARPDVVAAAHAHAVHGKAWSTLGRLLDPITQDACSLHGSHSLYAEFNGVVLDEEEGRNVAVALGPTNKAVILQNHGFLTVGATVEAAAWLFISADESARTQLLAEAAGTPLRIRDEVALPLGAGRDFDSLSFQPLWETITAEQPDLLT